MKFIRFIVTIFFVFILSVISFAQDKPVLTQVNFLRQGLPVEQTAYSEITVQLIFSKQMDENISPTVKYGLNDPYVFNVAEARGWSEDGNTVWEGRFTVSDIIPDDDGEYDFQIYGAKDTSGVEMDTTLSSSLDKTLFICRAGKMSLSTTTLDFDTLVIGTDKVLNITINNTSCAALDIESISIPPAAPFDLFGSIPDLVPANSAAQLSVRFIPGERTSYNSTLTIKSNDRQQNEHTIQLIGSAKGPKIKLWSGSPLNFGKVEKDSSKTLSTYVVNLKASNPVYSDTLIVNEISTSNSVFQANVSSLVVAPGDTKKVDVTFTPTQRVSYEANLQFSHNDETNPTLSITLNGNANDDAPPPPPSNIVPTWSGYNGYINGLYLPICWDNPDDPSGIAEIWWKFTRSAEPPTSADDTTEAGGRYVIGEDEVCANLNLSRITSGFWYCYIWLVDGRGNSGYTNYVPAEFYYDNEAPAPPAVVGRSIPSGQWFTNEDDFSLTIQLPDDSYLGAPDAVEVRWKYRVQPENGSDYDDRYIFNEVFENQVTFKIPFSETSLCGEDEVYIWLADSAGNASPDSVTLVDYRFDICSGYIANFSPTWRGGYSGYLSGRFFPICWSVEGDGARVVELYWKLSRTPAPPESADDFTNSIALEDNATCANLELLANMGSGRWYYYAWARFGTGNNSGYLNPPIQGSFVYDAEPPRPPVITGRKFQAQRWFSWLAENERYWLDLEILPDRARNVRDAAEVRWKFKTPPASGDEYDGNLVFSASNPDKIVYIPFDSPELCGEDSLYIWLADSSGNVSADSVTYTTYRFDICAPHITRFHRDTVNVAELGVVYRDTLVITDHSYVETASVSYRFGGSEASLQPRQLRRIAGTDSFIVEIPQAGVTRRGLEFRITASDSLDNVGIGPVETDLCDSDSLWFPVRTKISGEGDFRIDEDGRAIPLITSVDSTNYQLFSIPYALENNKVLAVLEDDLGPYDISKWRFFDYKPDTTEANRYLEGAAARPFVPGRSFFIATNREDIIVDSGPGVTVRTVCSDSIRLYEGWNLIATPFNFPVEKESLTLINSDSQIHLYSYELNNWNIKNRMDPWKGYALFVTREHDNDDPIYLVVRPKAAPERLAKGMDTFMPMSPDEWQIQVSAAAGNVYDTENWLGVRSEANPKLDRFDLAEPPVIGSFVKVAFPHKDWNLPVDDFSADFRPAAQIDNTWEFAVITNKVNTPVSLNFQFQGNLPEHAEIYLMDEAAGFSQNLRTQPLYTFTSGRALTRRSLKIIVGSQDYAIAEAGDIGLVPNEFELMQNYPNPFNPETQIRYNLPEAGSAKVEIFDLLGRNVATLVNNSNHQAGYHVVTWNGKNRDGRQVASGVYIYRLTTGKQTMARKMILMK